MYHGEGYTVNVDADTAGLLEANREIEKARRKINDLGNEANTTSKSFTQFNKSAIAVSSALKMPEINRLSRQMSELAGQIGAASMATDKATTVNARFTGVISNVSGLLGAGYVSNIGSATVSLLQHTQGAINATQAEVLHTRAIQMKAQALQAAASQEVINAKNLKASTQAELKAAQAALEHVYSLEGSNDIKQRNLESLRARQAAVLKDAEITYQMTASEENLQRVTKASNALHATETKIKTHLATTGKEIALVEARVAKAKEAETLATQKLNAALALEQKAKATLATTTDAVTVANGRAAQAARSQSIAMQGLRGVVGLLGGPTGVFMLATAGVYALYNAMNDDTATKEFNDRVDQWIDKIDELSAKQARAVANRLGEKIAETTTQLEGQKESLENTTQELGSYKRQLAEINKEIKSQKEQGIEVGSPYVRDDLVKAINELTKKQQQYELLISEGEQNIRRWTVSQGKAANIAKERAKQTDELSRAELIYQRQAKGIVDANQQLARSLELGSDAAVKKEQAIKELEKALIADGFVKDSELFKQKIQELTDELDKKASLNLANSLAEIEQRTQALTIGMKDGKPALDEYNASLLLMQMGIKKGSATYNTELPKAIEAIRNLREAQEAALNSKSNANKSLKAINKANDAIKKQQQQTETLRKEFELLSSGAANVNREMAIFNAVQSLGADATDKQKKAIAKEAAEVFDLKQKVDDFIKSQEITPELKLARAFRQESEELKRMFDNDFIDEETFKALGNKAMKAFDAGMAEIKINAVIDPITEAKGQYDPIQALANEHAKKLEMIRQFETEKGAITQRGLELMNAANTQYEQDRLNAQWEIWRNQSQANQFLADGLDALGQRSTNVLTGLLTQTQSINDAFRNVALTIVDQAVGALVQMGMQQVKNMIMGESMATAAQASALAQAAAAQAAWAPAALSASIATLGAAVATGTSSYTAAMAASKTMGLVAGARKNGGPVNAGSMYRVGEGGKPEIFKASNGNQYMIPGDNGRVISNRQMGKGGNGVSMGDMHFTFQVQAPNGITQKEAQQIQQMVRGTVYDVLGNEMRSGGALEKVRSW
ncbi:hypothetical protein [Proteus mirabilis]|uniref:hypothetical protein n=1 Tax=Proteus mirabilis TaxID=584 RepID=UPI0018C6F993|nr:hypothetical protein [Proteus mirabilis]MBG5951898.1 hypothetical protein [Proteus mirabilis]MDK6826030.1 hypothetical protein [Proteus mirabilis]MDK7830017.1 hypothetical protein [Proteus mirabilis]MDK8631815.1 hypothetical protein [Proteus mirabilis]